MHGSYSWQIKRRYKQISDLHQKLLYFKTKTLVPLPNKNHMDTRKTFRIDEKDQKKKGIIPRYPKKPEALVSFDGIEARMKQLENYINNLLLIDAYKNHPAMVRIYFNAFLCVLYS